MTTTAEAAMSENDSNGAALARAATPSVSRMAKPMAAELRQEAGLMDIRLHGPDRDLAHSRPEPIGPRLSDVGSGRASASYPRWASR